MDSGPYNYAFYYFAKEDDRTTPLYVAKNKQDFNPDTAIGQLIIDELNKTTSEH